MPTKNSKPSATLRSALASAEKSRGASNAETVADYGVASSAVMAGSAGLAKQMSRIQAVTHGVDRRTVRGVAKLSDKARQLQRRTIAEQNRISQNYGGAFGGSAALEFYGARARAGAGARSAEANVRLGVDQAKVGQLAAGIAQSGVVAGQAAASYALAQAMQSRFMVTNDTIAQLEGQLQQTALQYNLQLRNQKQAQQAAEDAATGSDKNAVKGLIQDGSTIATSIGTFVQNYKEGEYADSLGRVAFDNQAKFNVTQAVQVWATQQGYDPAGPEALLATYMLRSMQQGVNAGDAFKTAARTLYGNSPGFDKWGNPALDSVSSAVGAGGIVQSTLKDVLAKGGELPAAVGGGEWHPYTPGAEPATVEAAGSQRVIGPKGYVG
jgi:hypothetical protein